MSGELDAMGGEIVIAGLALFSCGVWAYLLSPAGRRTIRWPSHELSEIRHHPFLVVLVAVWIALQIAGRFASDPVPSLRLVRNACLSGMLIWLVLITLLRSLSRNGVAEHGIHFAGWQQSLRGGSIAFAAAMLPVTLLLLATLPFREVEAQHPFFHVLRAYPGPATFMWILLAVVVVAPLGEELIFRVVLQGWLQTRYPAAWAIGIAAAIFAAVHGWPDMLPLLPLALILGYLYWYRRDYLACVVAHSLFNGLYLLVAILHDRKDAIS
jgi:membrane protease YdiL (CAAX protease family)